MAPVDHSTQLLLTLKTEPPNSRDKKVSRTLLVLQNV